MNSALLVLLLQATFGLNPMIDTAAWNQAIQIRAGATLSATTNEFPQVVHFNVLPTNATMPYEKAGLLVEGVTHDPSTLTNTHDVVGMSGTVDIAADNHTGRAWGAYAAGGIQPGGDGLAIGMEIGLNNHGSSQPLMGTTTTKSVLGLVAGEGLGDNPATAFISMGRGTTQSFKGIVMNQWDFVDGQNADALIINGSPFRVNSGGDVFARGIRPVQFFPRFVVQPTQPTMAPGEVIVWGNSITGVTVLDFFDGGNYLKVSLNP